MCSTSRIFWRGILPWPHQTLPTARMCKS
uniref:Uncharacterized protein n=1 Tax=Anguilla anguilla TaxID=7936 RepID=A0A0E9VNU2_ANGAN